MANWNPSENSDESGDLVLVPHMRIDFNLRPKYAEKRYYSPYVMRGIIASALWDIVGYRLSEREIDLEASVSPVSTGYDYDPVKHHRHITIGDPGFFYLRDLTFIHQFPGDTFDQKFCNARQSIFNTLRTTPFQTAEPHSGLHLLSPFVRPSENPLKLVDLIKPDSTPTIVLKGLPSEYKPLIQKLLDTVGKVRDFDVSDNDVSVVFEDYEETCKALKKLCSHSLKKNGDSKTVDYELTLKGYDVSQETCNKSDFVGLSSKNNVTLALQLRMEKLEKEMKSIKHALMEASIADFGIDNYFKL